MAVFDQRAWLFWASVHMPINERNNQEQFLKTLANSTSYGIFAEMNPQESAEKAIEVIVHDESDRPFTTNVDSPERPGVYCFPPLAALITSAARLMLALLEREVTSRGGIYVFCDTDSMAIVATPDGGYIVLPKSKDTIKALSYREVDEIVEKFSLINPYDRQCVPGSVLKMEKENYVDSDSPAPLYCYAISSKRYVLLRNSGGAEPPRLEDIIKYSEHGLGHLRSPSSNEGGREEWMKQAWLYLLVKDFWGGEEAKKFEPDWLDLPALTQLSVPGPHVLKWFAQFNESKSYEEQVKPGNFFLMAHPDPMVPSKYRPIAPFEKDAAKWQELPWIDRLTGIRLRLTTRPSDGSIRPNEVRVRTYRDILTDYLAHPESKSLGPLGEKVAKSTRGLLRRRPVHASGFLTYLGKEGNKLDERAMGLVDETDQYQVQYVHPEKNLWNELVLATLRTMRRSAIEMSSGLDRRSIQRILNQGVFPHKINEVKLRAVAVAHASAMLFSWGYGEEDDEELFLRMYLVEHANRCTCRDCDA